MSLAGQILMPRMAGGCHFHFGASKVPSAVLATLAIGTTAPSWADAPAFNVPPPISTNAVNATFVAAADIDGDDNMDVITAEYGINTVAWYENNGASPPGWTKHIVDSAALGPVTIAVADLDGDGHLDILSANFNDEGVFWYRNSGAKPPVWTKRRVSADDQGGAWSVFAADLDGDGDLDAISGERIDLTVEWFENIGGSPLAWPTSVAATGVDPLSVHAADVDGDGDVDILAISLYTNTVLWIENNGGHPPTFTQHVITDTAMQPYSVFGADLDHDGDIDVLSASADDNTIAWYENDGGRPPRWTTHKITTTAPSATAVYAADLDGDSDIDVISGTWGDEVAWWENDGGSPPTFTKHTIATNCNGAEAVSAARLDRDADIDVLCASMILGQVLWYENLANFAETDGDGVRDDLDCAPNNASAFAVPGEVRGVRFPTKTSIAWTTESPSAGPGSVYDVMRGSAAQFPVGTGGGETCLIDATAATSLPDGSTPVAGRAFYYLVRGSNACGVGSYGFSTSGVERASSACP